MGKGEIPRTREKGWKPVTPATRPHTRRPEEVRQSHQGRGDPGKSAKIATNPRDFPVERTTAKLFHLRKEIQPKGRDNSQSAVKVIPKPQDTNCLRKEKRDQNGPIRASPFEREKLTKELVSNAEGCCLQLNKSQSFNKSRQQRMHDFYPSKPNSAELRTSQMSDASTSHLKEGKPTAAHSAKNSSFEALMAELQGVLEGTNLAQGEQETCLPTAPWWEKDANVLGPAGKAAGQENIHATNRNVEMNHRVRENSYSKPRDRMAYKDLGNWQPTASSSPVKQDTGMPAVAEMVTGVSVAEPTDDTGHPAISNQEIGQFQTDGNLCLGHG